GTVERPERGPALERDERSDLPASEQVAECALLSVIEGQFVNGVSRESLWSIISGARSIGAPIEGILRDGNLSADGSIEGIRCGVDERATGIMRAGTESALEPAIQTELHGMVDRGCSVSVNPDHTGSRINSRAAEHSESTGGWVVNADRNR